MFSQAFLLAAASLPYIVSGQLATSYQLGPITTAAAKWSVKVCDITKYRAVADGVTDTGPATLAAFNARKTGGVSEY